MKPGKDTRDSRGADSKKVSAPPPENAGAPVPPPAAGGSTVRWFLSGAVRQATAMRKHVRKILNHQRDLLTPKAVTEVEMAMQRIPNAIAAGAGKATLEKEMESLEKAANQWLKPYPHSSWRENIEVLLVALTVAMAIRTFFLQPFKIPTGSMQPTLFGVTSDNLINRPDFKIPGGLPRIKEWFQGISYVHIVAQTDGPIEQISAPVRILIFNVYQKFVIGGKTHSVWFPPDYGEQLLKDRAQLDLGRVYRKGEDVIRLRVQAGDHLFVDRVTYNFRPPERGEIIVFETKGIPEERRVNPPFWMIPADQFYIKRLVGLGGERIQIGDDRHLVANGVRLDASTPHFENVYTFKPAGPFLDSHYSGHENNPRLAPYFYGKPEGVMVSPDHCLAMGDNTMNSLDSRSWGEFPARNVIGKSFFVYWPITQRFGWGQR